MATVSTKRERLLDWIQNGSPDDVPVMIGFGQDAAASYLGKEPGALSWPEVVRASEEAGTHGVAIIGGPMPFDALPFLDDVRVTTSQEKLPDGGDKTIRHLETREGVMREIVEAPKTTGSYHREFFVKGPEDVKVWADFILRATAECASNPEIRRRGTESIRAGMEAVGGQWPTMVWVFCPVVELTSSYYMDQATAIYLLHDEEELMEELMASHWGMTQVWLEVCAELQVDFLAYAINGYEWLSPRIYERWATPQATRINEFATAHGMRSWLHTCGKLKRIAAGGTYNQMKVDVLESLATLPTGDIDDMAQTRRDIGEKIATRGGINVEFFYEESTEALVRQAEMVLEGCAGFKHMLGDTNSSYPPYPWKNIQAVIDLVRSQGRLYE